jgi:hypothetical protein
MIILLLVIHITLLSISLLVTMSTTFAAVMGYKVSSTLIRFNMLGTGIGLTAGILLLLQSPLDIKCLILLGYLAAFMASQVYITRRNQAFASVES